MKLLNRALTTGVALMLTAGATAVAAQDASLVISSASFDAAHDRLCIKGENFGTASRNGGVAAPYVTIDRVPMAVLSASTSQVDVALSRTFPPGSYLLTVARGNGQGQASSFFVTIGGQGPAGPQGPMGEPGAKGPEGPAGLQGLQGADGPRGADGQAGGVGPVGPIGPSGPVGPQGAPGVSGYEIVSASTHSANLASGDVLSARAACPAGKRPLGGGVQALNAFHYATVSSSFPDPASATWVGEIRNNSFNSAGATDVVVYAICGKVQ